MKIIYNVLIIVSMVGVLLSFGGTFQNSVDIIEFFQLFIYVSLPFIFAAMFGWRKGFLLSLLISTMVLLITTLTRGTGQDADFLYSVFFTSFSLFYFLVACVISFFMNKINKQY